MAAAFDHPGRNHAHRAVAGGEGLVQSGHRSPDGGLIVEQMNHEAASRQIKGCLHPADSGTGNQH